MMPQPLPAELQSLVGSTPYDFAAKATHRFKRKKVFSLFFFSIFWLGITSTMMFGMITSFLSGQDVHMAVNDVEKTYNIADGAAASVMGLGFPLLFIFVGIGLFTLGIYQFFAKGYWYIGTVEALIQYSPKETRHINWESFSGDIRSNQKSVTLVMRTGKMEKRGKNGSQYVPDEIYMGGIEQASEVARISRERIAQHDPTPISQA